MEELRALIREFLLTKHPRVYFNGDAPSDATLPYITFYYQPSNIPDESKKIIMIDIDLWDIPENNKMSILEALADSVKGDGNIIDSSTGLDEAKLESDNLIVLCRFETDQYVTEEDKTIKHILQNYQISIFKKEAL